jgi:site-specific DNA-methyltransferase (adenine-specific)/adenine-specific DNA-methyltransferase
MPTLDWIGKKAVVNHHHEVPFHLLKCNDELSVGDPGSGNLLVQGDNLLALKALLPYYAGQVKCIYIDPPYNTGNESWVYNDNTNSPEIRDWLGKAVGKEGETLDRHDRWLCMMYPRLALLREFLREDGAIFISIDDNEVHMLRGLLDEIYGSRNFITTLIWQKIYTVKNSARHFSEMHDYILVYAKDLNKWQRNLLPRSEELNESYTNPDNDPRGPWTTNAIQARNYYSQGSYEIMSPAGRVFTPPAGTYWRVSKDSFEQLNADNRIWWGRTGNSIPRIKKFLSEVKQGVVPATIWLHGEAGQNAEAKAEVREILAESGDFFITPKPSKLIRKILQVATDKDSIILDSFSGSGTTGHAVLAQNAEDGGNRRYLLVEMDPSIATNITRERVKRVTLGYTNPKGKKIDALGGGFRYCELGEPLFTPEGRIEDDVVSFKDLAHHVFFIATGEPLPQGSDLNTPLIGVANGVAVYLLYNGILGDRSANGGNVLTRDVLALLPSYDGPRIIYGNGCRIAPERLRRENITFRQVPYEVRVY